MGHMTSQVNIAHLKAHLSQYLRSVQKGHEVVIKDRETPIARLVPVEVYPMRLITRLPTKALKDLDKLPGVKPKRLKPGDLERAIQETKQDWYDKWLDSKSTLTRR